MVRDFGKMGVVELRQGVLNDPDLPPFMFVESRPGFAVEDIPPRRNLVMLHTPEGSEGAPRAAADAAIEASGRPAEEVVTGYHDEVHRFVRRPYVLVPTNPELEGQGGIGI
jgi:hypothetical protein